MIGVPDDVAADMLRLDSAGRVIAADDRIAALHRAAGGGKEP